MKNINYTTTDLISPIADVKADICNLPFKDKSFDIVTHIYGMEHIPLAIEKDVLLEELRVSKKYIYHQIATSLTANDKERKKKGKKQILFPSSIFLHLTSFLFPLPSSLFAVLDLRRQRRGGLHRRLGGLGRSSSALAGIRFRCASPSPGDRGNSTDCH